MNFPHIAERYHAYRPRNGSTIGVTDWGALILRPQVPGKRGTSGPVSVPETGTQSAS